MAEEKSVQKRHASRDIVRGWMHLAQVLLFLLHCRLPVHCRLFFYLAKKKENVTRFQTQSDFQTRRDALFASHLYPSSWYVGFLSLTQAILKSIIASDTQT